MSQQTRPNTGPNAWAAPVIPAAPSATAPVAQPAGGESSQVNQILNKVPMTTLLFMAANIAVYAYQSLWTVQVMDFSISTFFVAYRLQLYRIITSAFFHGSIMHIGMNMMSFYALGSSLERLYGTVAFFYMLWLFVMLGGAMYVAICFVLAYGGSDMSWMVYNSIGFSGVLFSLAVLESFNSPAPTRSVFGMVSVPTKVYPWVLLVLISVIMPNISFVGHLAGLLVGFAFSRNWLSFATPSKDAFEAVEGMQALTPLKAYGGFIPVTPPPTYDIDPAVSAAIAAAIAASQQQPGSQV